MHHNLSAETKRRLALSLAPAPAHLNRRRRFPERSVAFLLCAWLLILLAEA